MVVESPEQKPKVEKVELYLKGEVPAVAAWGIDLAPDTAEFLGLNPENNTKFDYIDFSTDEIASDTSLTPEARAVYPDRLTSIMMHSPTKGQWPETSKQLEGLKSLLRKVFYPANLSDQSLQNEWIESINHHPNKKFLILFGHGVSFRKMLNEEERWEIGGYSDNLSTDFLGFFKNLDKSQYSSILVISCNPGELGLPNDSDVPVFYKSGNAGFTEAGLARRS